MSEISQYTESLHEECGVFGMYDKTGETDMVNAVYSALYALQHRGQESCGIALNVDGVLSGYRDLGLVSEVFTKRVLEELPRGAKMATGHVRYATAGQRLVWVIMTREYAPSMSSIVRLTAISMFGVSRRFWVSR